MSIPRPTSPPSAFALVPHTEGLNVTISTPALSLSFVSPLRNPQQTNQSRRQHKSNFRYPPIPTALSRILYARHTVEAAPRRSQCKALVSSRSAVATAPRTGDKSERLAKGRKKAEGTTKKKKEKKKRRESCTRQAPTNRSGKGKQTTHKRTRQSVTFGLLTFRDYPTLRQANKRRDTQKDEWKLDISGEIDCISCPHSVALS